MNLSAQSKTTIKEGKMKNTNRLSVIVFLALSVIIESCSLFKSVSPFDPTTYLNLLELKIYTRYLYDTFSSETVNDKEITFVENAIQKAILYERSKGESNKPTVDQFEKIMTMFTSHVADRRTGGKWSSEHLNNQLENILEAYDVARETELLKNNQ